MKYLPTVPRLHGFLSAACMSILALFLYLTYRNGMDAHVRIHDNLDLIISWYRVLRESGTFWGPLDATVPQIFNGLPRNTMVSSLNIFPSFFMLMDPLHAYVLTEVIARVTGYVGMLLLLRRHVLGDRQTALCHFVALTFALVPLTHVLYLTAMGQPLVLYAFLNLRTDSGSIHNWVILGLFPFGSSLVLGGFAIIIGLTSLTVWEWIHTRRLNLAMAGAVALVSVGYAVVEYRLIYQLLFERGYVSHRTAWVQTVVPYGEMLPTMIRLFFRGQYHVETLQIPLVVSLPLCVVYRMISLRRTTLVPHRHLRIVLSLLGVTIATACFPVIWNAAFMIPVKDTLTILQTFGWERIAFIEPVLKYMLFAIALGFLARSHIGGRALVCALLVLQVGYAFWYTTYHYYQPWKQVTFGTFFGESLFGQVRDYIGDPQASYRVGSLGFHPAISQYNGYYTLDGYAPDYPLSYKGQFRRIIAPELAKNPEWRSYFDDWGSRVYLYDASELLPQIVARRTEIDVEQFKALGGRFLFSAWRILNAEEIGLTFHRVFRSDEFAWPIYLYEAR